jgi:hypothetical protein
LLVGPLAAYGYLTATVAMSDSDHRALSFAFTASVHAPAADSVALALS